VRRILRATSFYEVLSVTRTAEAVEVKRAYRRLALAVHPDRNTAPGASDAFKKVNTAFECLHNSERRRDYDATGRMEDAPIPQRAPQRRYAARGDFMDDDDDLFGAFFGGSMPPGMRFRFNAGPPRTQPRYHFHTGGGAGGAGGAVPGAAAFAGLLQLLPLILLLLAAWFSLRQPAQQFSLSRTASNVLEMKTLVGGVRYYVADRGVVQEDATLRKTIEEQVLSSYVGAVDQECRTQRYNAQWAAGFRNARSDQVQPACAELDRVRAELNAAKRATAAAG
jgi:curved DNA-binding protein CbpA